MGDPVQPLVNPSELDGFKKVQAAIASARRLADSITTVENHEDAGRAADALKALRLAREDVEIERKAAKDPYLVTGRVIDADFNELNSPVEAAEESLKARVKKWEDDEKEKAEAEQKRLEKNARERQKRENERAQREQRVSKHVPVPGPREQPRGGRGSHGNLVPRTVTKYEITNEAELPDEYVKRVPDRKKIKAAVDAGLVVPGTRVWPETEYQTR